MITSTSSAPRNRISDRSLHVLAKALTHSVLQKLRGTTQEAETEERLLEVSVGFQLVGRPCVSVDISLRGVNYGFWYHVV